MPSFLIVRLGAIGDIVHALPLASALRARYPEARIDWVVDERYAELLDLVPIIDRRIVLSTKSLPPIRRIVALYGKLVRESYDVAIDVQGLLKSAVVARLSRARRVLGFPVPHLREAAARFFYSETHRPGISGHVIEALDAVRATAEPAGGRPFAVLNPGASWPNKRWPPERFGAVGQWLDRELGLRSVVTWGVGERALAAAVVAESDGTAEMAPATSIADLTAIVREAELVISGDTGPAHLAAALGTPVVGLYGPTDISRNGPWLKPDFSVSRFAACGCHYRRRCRIRQWCLGDIRVADVTDAIGRRFDGL
jgi:ADP-heptose:LPS heptosyltransferase